MADSALQDIALTFQGKTYRFRPTFSVLVGIEAATHQASRALGMKIWNGEAALIEIATVMQVLLREKEVEMGLDVIGEALMEDGFLPLIEPLGSFLTWAQRGHKEHEREAKEAAERAKKEAKKGAGQETPEPDPS